MTRNSIFKGKKLKVKPLVEKELMVGKKGEEDEVSLKREKIILDLINKNEKLKMKLQQEKKIGTFLFFFICDIVGLNNCNGVHVVVQS